MCGVDGDLEGVEHLASPEDLLRGIRHRYCEHAPEVVITTGNVAFLPVRLALLCGQFNYGKRGILDLTHCRLFTFSSFGVVLLLGGPTRATIETEIYARTTEFLDLRHAAALAFVQMVAVVAVTR